MNGWDKLVDYIRKHKRQLEDDEVAKVGPDELTASAPLFTIFKRHYDSGQSAVCVLGGFEPYDPDGYPHHVVVCDGDTEDMSDNELRQELGLEPGAELEPRGRTQGRAQGKNPYQEFCKATRPELLAADPAMTFAQVGKRLGELWRKKKAGGGDTATRRMRTKAASGTGSSIGRGRAPAATELIEVRSTPKKTTIRR